MTQINTATLAAKRIARQVTRIRLPTGVVQSHHPIQQEWAKQQMFPNGDYSSRAAPAVLLSSTSGSIHAQISGMQRAFRNQNGFNTDVQTEFNEAARQMGAAGVPESVVRRAIRKNLTYLDCLGGLSMLNKAYLSQHFELRIPATTSQIHVAEAKVGLSFPKEYVDLLQITNGLNSMGCLALHEIEILPERNVDYEVQKCLPGYFMIGDDGGGQAILINSSGEVFEVGMGVMNPKFLERSADSLTDLLVNLKGLTLGER